MRAPGSWPTGFAIASAVAFVAVLVACASPARAQQTNFDAARQAVDRITPAEWSANYATLLSQSVAGVPPAELEALAGSGDARAQDLVGEAYLTGAVGFPHDDVQAVHWLNLSAAQGFAGGQSTLGWAYQAGVGGLKVDLAEAARLYRLAADQNEAGGLVNLGALYLQGLGVPQDFAEARNLFERAEPYRVAAAFANLGLIYQHGYGVPADLQRAEDYYRHCGTETCLVLLNQMNGSPDASSRRG